MKLKIKSKTDKKKFIYSDLNSSKKSKHLLIFLSYLTGSIDLPLFIKAEEVFGKYRFDTLRLNFCNDENLKKTDTFDLSDVDFNFYTTELRNIIDSLREKYGYEKIILVGHSFGAVIDILFLNKHKSYKKFTRLILWEPSVLPWERKFMEEDFVFEKSSRLYTDKYTKEKINKKFYEQCVVIKNTIKTFGLLKMPTLIIAAKGSADADSKKYFEKARGEKMSEFIVIDNTDHLFKGASAKKQLFSATINYLNKIL